MRCAGPRREVFGMAGERQAGLADDALLYGSRDHAVVVAGAAAVTGNVEEVGDVAGVGRIEAAGLDRCGRRYVQELQFAGPVRGRLRCVDNAHGRAQFLGALAQHGAIAHEEQAGRKVSRGQRKAQVRPDAGRLAGGDGESGPGACRAANCGSRRTPHRAGAAAKARFPRRPCRSAAGRRPCAAFPRRSCPECGGRAPGRCATRTGCGTAR